MTSSQKVLTRNSAPMISTDYTRNTCPLDAFSSFNNGHKCEVDKYDEFAESQIQKQSLCPVAEG